MKEMHLIGGWSLNWLRVAKSLAMKQAGQIVQTPLPYANLQALSCGYCCLI